MSLDCPNWWSLIRAMVMWSIAMPKATWKLIAKVLASPGLNRQSATCSKELLFCETKFSIWRQFWRRKLLWVSISVLTGWVSYYWLFSYLSEDISKLTFKRIYCIAIYYRLSSMNQGRDTELYTGVLRDWRTIFVQKQILFSWICLQYISGLFFEQMMTVVLDSFPQTFEFNKVRRAIFMPRMT